MIAALVPLLVALVARRFGSGERQNFKLLVKQLRVVARRPAVAWDM